MYTLDNIRPVWAEVNLDNLVHNIQEIRKNVSSDSLVTAVVKANAYGHGSVVLAKLFLENGADRLAVATLSEAIELRQAGIDSEILVLGYTQISEYGKLIDYNITQTIFSLDQGIKISDKALDLGKNIKIHIKLDTGMSRLGFLCTDDSVDEINRIYNLPNVEIEGIFTHFARADEFDKSFTQVQYSRFMEMVKKLNDQGVSIPIRHVSNSAAIIDIGDYNLDMVRAGIMLYGLYPSNEVKRDIDLRPAMALKTKISHIKDLDESIGISYGHAYKTDKKTRVGTLPLGYADGFTRLFFDKVRVCIGGHMVKVIGKICMDQCMVDLTDFVDIEIGDEVTIFGYEDGLPTAEDLGNVLGTINYEIVCMVGRRVPRVYIRNNQIVDYIDYLID